MDADGRPVLTATAQAHGLTVHPDSYVVTSDDDTLGLATVVGLVETCRLMVKRRRGSASVAATG